MNIDDRLGYLLETAFTTNDAAHQLQLWRECLEYALYHTTATDIVVAAAEYGAALAATADRAVVSSWPTAIWEDVHANNFTAVYDALTAKVNTLPVLILYVPTALDAEEVAELGDWCRVNCHVTLLDLKVDPAVVGGVGFIDTQQRYQEISFRSKLAEHPACMTDVITRYV